MPISRARSSGFCSRATSLIPQKVDTAGVVRLVPNLVHAALLAWTDQSVLNLCRRVFQSGRLVRFAWICWMTCWFVQFAGIRAFSNSIELALVAACAASWPSLSLERDPSRRLKHSHCEQVLSMPLPVALALGALACWLRPTAAVPLGLLGILHLIRLWRHHGISFMFHHLAMDILPPLATALVILAGLEAWMHHCMAPAVGVGILLTGKSSSMQSGTDPAKEALPLPALNFLSFNAARDLGSLYGTHSAIWYWTEGLPPVLGPGCIFLVIALAQWVWDGGVRAREDEDDDDNPKDDDDTLKLILRLADTKLVGQTGTLSSEGRGGRGRGGGGGAHRGLPVRWLFDDPAVVLAALGICCMAMFSLGSHKEHRFLLPVLPLFVPAMGTGMFLVVQAVGTRCCYTFSRVHAHSSGRAISSRDTAKLHKHAIAATAATVAGMLALTNTVLLFLFGWVHQRGPMAAVEAATESLLAGQTEGRWRLGGTGGSTVDMAPPLASMLFLCGCHCAPLYSQLHVKVPVAYFDCRPEARAADMALSDAFLAGGAQSLMRWGIGECSGVAREALLEAASSLQGLRSWRSSREHTSNIYALSELHANQTGCYHDTDAIPARLVASARPTHVIAFQSFIEGHGALGRAWLEGLGMRPVVRSPHNLAAALQMYLSRGPIANIVEEESAYVELWVRDGTIVGSLSD